MLSNYEIKTVDLYNNPIGIFKTLVPKFFDKAKYVFHYELYLKLELRLRKCIVDVLEFNQWQWLKLYLEFNTKKEWRQKKWQHRWKSAVKINEQYCVW